ncbi:hypothetical protein Taro_001108 [Colocasia esculenta]|uniref:Secreted protein n=1 Tax=Colocasia esculenta TaxID=4460 RepID=A0A843T8Z7_COLES|nr:hypothetical protein [Colocasia esculenta]
MKWCVPLCLHELWFGTPCEASAHSREADSDQVRYRFNGLGRGVPPQLVSEQEISGMADRRDWGGGGDDPEEGESEEDVSRPSSSSEPRRSDAGSVPPAV